jgi:hypothetical protein
MTMAFRVLSLDELDFVSGGEAGDGGRGGYEPA